MIVKAFRQDKLAGSLLMAMLTIVLALGSSSGNGIVDDQGAMPLFLLVRGTIALVPWFSTVVSASVVMLVAMQITWLANRSELFERRNQLPALLLPTLVALNGSGFVVSAALCGMPLVIWAFQRAWSVGSREHALRSLFDAGLLLGAASMVYLPYAFLVVAIWASNAVLRPFSWREHLVPMVGLALVFHLCWGALLLVGLVEWDLRAALIRSPSERLRAVDVAQWPISWMVIALFAIPTWHHFSRSYSRSVMSEKNIRSAFLALTVALAVIGIGEALLTRQPPMVLFAVPLSVLIGYPLLHARRLLLAECGVWLLLGAAFWVQWGGLLYSPA